jgi:hypothetical protein
MKKNILALVAIALVTILLVSFTPQRVGSVRGTVNPADAATQVWLVSEKDTFHASIRNGGFEFTGVKPGTCMLIVDAIAPYKTTIRTGIEVFEGSETNVGEILLDQVKKR